ncbi:MAG: DUF4468 domain-containing protein [Bacteroidetes bacterium]|nr:DUF4468 domain-containing protein [Bacteroidota bacterium]MBU1719618.1 DUF4468 domain-containing protein [Bacteroidota bacterium]
MKKLLLILALAIPTFQLSAQTETPVIPVDEATKLITYQKVVNVEAKKDELFNKAIGWINGYYANPSGVTKKRDLASGLIEGVARFDLMVKDAKGVESKVGVVEYKLTLNLKDTKYRYTLSEFVYKQASKFPCEKWLDTTAPGYQPAYADYLNALDTFANGLIADMTAKIEEKEVKKNDEW